MAEETPKSPKNPLKAEAPKYVSKCLQCGHPADEHPGGDLDAHPSPVLPVTDEDVALWTAAGDSPFAIERRILVRGRTH